jgi:hypothetical protein
VGAQSFLHGVEELPRDDGWDGNRNPVCPVAKHPSAFEDCLCIPGRIRRGCDPVEVPHARIGLVLEHGFDLAKVPTGTAEARPNPAHLQIPRNVHQPISTAREHLEHGAHDGCLLFIHDQRGWSGGGLSDVVIPIDAMAVTAQLSLA